MTTICELIADPSRRIKFHVATTESGDIADPSDEGATKFCIQGAFMRAYGNAASYRIPDTESLRLKLLSIIPERYHVCENFWGLVCTFNNHTNDHAAALEVARVLDDHMISNAEAPK